MDVEEFRVRGKEIIDFICHYNANITDYKVTPDVEPGYLKKLLPDEAPEEPEEWKNIMEDFHKAIVPGMTHWTHPHFHAYFPSGNSYPSILGDLLANGFGSIGFSWAANPVCTELEIIVLDWFGKAIGLPYDFITSNPGSEGGGVIQPSASESIFICMLAARNNAIQFLKGDNSSTLDSEFLPKLVCYCSSEAHSCVEKAAKILLVQIRILKPDENGSLRGDALRDAMEKDKENGLFPFFVTAILGSTGTGSFDNLQELGPICKDQPCVWLHADGAYAGNSFICSELKVYLKGMEYIDSFNTNTNKWLLNLFDCSCLWVKNRSSFTKAFVVNAEYLKHANQNEAIDFRHWGIPLSRKFRALKLWFVIRNYGLSGLQKYIRNHITLAKYFESFVQKDERFEVVNNVRLGLVCFRLLAPDSVNQALLASINGSGKIHMIPSMFREKYIIRFVVDAEHATHKDVEYAWCVITEHASRLLRRDSIVQLVPELMSKINARRHSFTKSVSKEIYKDFKKKSHLTDFASPIMVIEDDEESETN